MQGAIQVLGAGRPWFMVQPTLVAMSFGLGVSLKYYSLVAAIFAAFRATNDFVAAASYCGALHEVARSRASQGFGYESDSSSTAATTFTAFSRVCKNDLTV